MFNISGLCFQSRGLRFGVNEVIMYLNLLYITRAYVYRRSNIMFFLVSIFTQLH